MTINNCSRHERRTRVQNPRHIKARAGGEFPIKIQDKRGGIGFQEDFWSDLDDAGEPLNHETRLIGTAMLPSAWALSSPSFSKRFDPLCCGNIVLAWSTFFHIYQARSERGTRILAAAFVKTASPSVAVKSYALRFTIIYKSIVF